MPHTTLIICTVLSVILALLVVVKPLFWEKKTSYFISEENYREFDESVSYLEMLSEIEADYQMGKISKPDFESLSLEYKRLFLATKKTSS
jgi:hypothetical protein